MSSAYYSVFAGEALALVSRGRVRAPLHYVDDRVMGQPRVSLPFFLRPRPNAAVWRPSSSQQQDRGDAGNTSRGGAVPAPPHFVAQVLSSSAATGGWSAADAITQQQFVEQVLWHHRPWGAGAYNGKDY